MPRAAAIAASRNVDDRRRDEAPNRAAAHTAVPKQGETEQADAPKGESVAGGRLGKLPETKMSTE